MPRLYVEILVEEVREGSLLHALWGSFASLRMTTCKSGGKGFRCSCDGAIDVRLRVGGAEEGRLELRRRQIDPVFQHGAMESAEALGVRSGGAGPISYLSIGEKPCEHGA